MCTNLLNRMSVLLECFYLLSLLSATCGFKGYREIIIKEDRPYELINVSIPREIWKQAFRPTPVLKSQATIVLPVQVTQDEEENYVQGELEDELAPDPAVVVDEVTPAVVNDEQIVQEPTTAPAISGTSQSPAVNDEELAPEQPVNGQVSRFPCSCPGGQCGCCTGAILQRINMKACGNISFIPEDFVFDVRLSVNNNTVIRRRVSASDPPPICFNPRRAPFVQVCAEISNIRIRNRNAFACLDITANIAAFPIYSASFRCFGLGSSGVQTGLKPKPISSGPPTVSIYGNDNEDEGGFLQNAASGILSGDGPGLLGGGDGPGIFGGEGGLFDGGGSDDDGPLGALGDAVGDIFEGRHFDRV